MSPGGWNIDHAVRVRLETGKTRKTDALEKTITWRDTGRNMLQNAPPYLPLHILLLGDAARPEFSETLDTFSGDPRLFCFSADVEFPQDYSPSERFSRVDLIVLLQSRARQFPPEVFEKWRREFPLARPLRLVGPWLAGDLRVGPPWPGVTRVFWHEWRTYLESQLDDWARRGTARWGWPVTLAPEELALLASESPPQGPIEMAWPAYRPRKIAIWANDEESRVMLELACRRQGFDVAFPKSLRELRETHVRGVIFDSEDGAPDRLALEALRAWSATAPLLFIMGFPRPEDERLIAEYAPATLLAKPFSLATLTTELDRLGRTIGS